MLLQAIEIEMHLFPGILCGLLATDTLSGDVSVGLPDLSVQLQLATIHLQEQMCWWEQATGGRWRLWAAQRGAWLRTTLTLSCQIKPRAPMSLLGLHVSQEADSMAAIQSCMWRSAIDEESVPQP